MDENGWIALVRDPESGGRCIRLNAEERYTAAELIRELDKVSG